MSIESSYPAGEDYDGAVTDISYDELHKRFERPNSEIRVLLNWDALQQGMDAGKAKVTLQYAPRWNPAHLYAPWYKDSLGNHVTYDHPEAVPWTFAELIQPRPWIQPFDRMLPNEHPLHHNRFFEDARILSMDVGEDQDLVLDGNHRLMLKLGHLAGYNIPLPWYRIQAPLDPPLVPDVEYWQKIQADLAPTENHPNQLKRVIGRLANHLT